MGQGNFRQITPFMHVRDLADAKAFFVDVLGFSVTYEEPGYAYFTLAGIAMRVLECDERYPPSPGTRAIRYYVDVEDVDAIYRELKPKLDRLPPGDVHGPADKPYRQRELYILAPDGDIFAFGAPVKG
jgi:catechol 2,3-dioxygenase-like lactoylglutathione lyase family enzyme